MFKNTKKRKAAVLFLGLAALMVPSTTLMAQYDGNGGLFGKGAETEAGASNGIFLSATDASNGLFMLATGANSFDITTGQFGGNGGQAGGNYGISIGTFGQEPPAPLGSGLFIMAAAGAAYAFSKKRKQQENK
jgi:hypothetical protein